jgi:hypothetical protein
MFWSHRLVYGTDDETYVRAWMCRKTFDTGIVPAVARTAHAGGDIVLAEQPLIATCRVLAVWIRMVQQPHCGLPVHRRYRYTEIMGSGMSSDLLR